MGATITGQQPLRDCRVWLRWEQQWDRRSTGCRNWRLGEVLPVSDRFSIRLPVVPAAKLYLLLRFDW